MMRGNPEFRIEVLGWDPPGGLALAVATHQFRLQRLVDHEVDHRLADAKVAGRDALVEAQQAGLPVYPADAVAHRHFVLGIVVQLQARLDEPDRIRGGGGGESRTGGGQQMHDRRVGGKLLLIVEECLSLRVRTKVDRPRGCDTDDVGTETFEEGSGALRLDDQAQALHNADRLRGRGHSAVRRHREDLRGWNDWLASELS